MMRRNLFKLKPTETREILKKLDLQLSDATIKRIDTSIRKAIAKDSDQSKFLNYIKKELSSINISKEKFDQACLDLEKAYIEDSGYWTFHQNLFCFFSLIISIIWMCTQLVKLYDHDTVIASDCAQFGIHMFFICLFFIVDFLRKRYTMRFFGEFLEKLNRHVPATIMLGMALCYLSLYLCHALWLSALLIIISLAMLLYSIVLAWIKMCP